MTAVERSVRVRIHGVAEREAALVRMVSAATAKRSLGSALDELCRMLAAIAPADVASVYLREEDEVGEHLVMRANVGFPRGAVGNVRLGMGEGITGFAAEHLCPISTEIGPESSHWRPVPGLGEEQFPAFLAVPLVRTGRAEGVLVLQRGAGRAFSSDEVALAVSLSAAFLLALEHARVRREVRKKSSHAALATAQRARLTGQGICPGIAIGRIRPLPALAGSFDRVDPAAIAPAVDALAKTLGRALRKLPLDPAGPHRDAIFAMQLLLEDRRLRDQLVEATDRHGVARGLREVAREYALTPLRAGIAGGAGAWLADRAEDVQEFSLLAAALAAGSAVPASGDALVLGGRLGAVVALAAIARRASAVIAAEAVDESSFAAALLAAAGIPVVSEVAGLYDWTCAGDSVIVDGSAGVVRVNPAPALVARVRRGV